MKNKKGDFGVINSTGKIGSPAHIIPIDSPDFYENIEKGIKSTVRTILSVGYITYSSCEGHKIEGYDTKTVTVILKNSDINKWKNMISRVNAENEFKNPISYLILDSFKDNLECHFMILIGSVFDNKETLIKQECLNKAVLDL